MHFTTFEGLRVGYRREGKGPALVFVHGTGGDGAANWAAGVHRLRRNRG